MTKNKYLPNDDDIPSNYNLGKEKANKMLDNIEKNRAKEAGGSTVTVYEEVVEILPLDTDFDIARNNISDLLDVSADAIKEYYKFAIASDSPRAMEVLANMIKSTVDMNKDFIDIHQQKERINSTKINNGTPISNEPSGNTQNNITSQTNILCSPGDLVKMLQQEQLKAEASAAIDIIDIKVE